VREPEGRDAGEESAFGGDAGGEDDVVGGDAVGGHEEEGGGGEGVDFADFTSGEEG